MQMKSVLCLAMLLTACTAAPVTARDVADRIDPAGLAAIVDREAALHGVPPRIARAVVRVESRWNPRTTGRAGEVGLFQIKHRSAQEMGFTGSRAELYEPATNIRFGMKYLAEAYRLGRGDLCRTMLKYQGGHYANRPSALSNAYCTKVRAVLAAN